MSMDNGHIIRVNAEGKYVLQQYFDSADEFPPVEDGVRQYDTLDEACSEYNRMTWDFMEKTGYPLNEYGLTIRI